jgi:hypothetical protein
MLDFFLSSYNPDTSTNDLSVLCTVFLFLFMEPQQGRDSPMFMNYSGRGFNKSKHRVKERFVTCLKKLSTK